MALFSFLSSQTGMKESTVGTEESHCTIWTQPVPALKT